MDNCTLVGFNLAFMLSGILFIYLVGLITGYEIAKQKPNKTGSQK
jgi:hypothetical protein